MIRMASWPMAAFFSFCLVLGVAGCGRAGPGGESPAHSSEDHHDSEEHGGTLHLVQAAQEVLGITIVPAEVKPLEQTLEVTGQIAQDTDRIVHVNAPEAGSLTKLLVTSGQRVEAQQPLAELTPSNTMDPVEVLAPQAGLILGVHVSSGAPADPLTCLLTIADLSRVWATFDVYEQDIGRLQVGQRIEAQSVAYPDRVFRGTIVFISPQVDQDTRTIKVRADIENPEYALKLGMFVTGTVYIPTADEALVVPQEAVQHIEDKDVVFVQTEPERFEPRDVRIGTATRTQAHILEGLQAGELVAASGSFHLKAELLKETLEEGHAH